MTSGIKKPRRRLKHKVLICLVRWFLYFLQMCWLTLGSSVPLCSSWSHLCGCIQLVLFLEVLFHQVFFTWLPPGWESFNIGPLQQLYFNWRLYNSKIRSLRPVCWDRGSSMRTYRCSFLGDTHPTVDHTSSLLDPRLLFPMATKHLPLNVKYYLNVLRSPWFYLNRSILHSFSQKLL